MEICIEMIILKEMKRNNNILHCAKDHQKQFFLYSKNITAINRRINKIHFTNNNININLHLSNLSKHILAHINNWLNMDLE